MSCILTFEQVDELQTATRRIRLFGNLVINEWEAQWKDGELINEAMQELVSDMMEAATAIDALVEAGWQAAGQDTAVTG